VDDLKERYRAGKVGDVEVKTKLAKAINNFLAPMRERRAHFESRATIVDEIIIAGNERMRAEARVTMQIVRDAMGLAYYK
jgi:tryptophanyl-tRNA synthetase